MANKGYADDDGTRTPGGIHDEGKQSGVSYYDVRSMMLGATVRDSLNNDLPLNHATDSEGRCVTMTPNYPVDGDANTNPVHRATADYPAFQSQA